MKKLISALSVLLLGFMYSGCTENSPTQVSEDQDRTAIEDGSFVAGDVAALGKGRDCDPWPECNKKGDSSSDIEYIVNVVAVAADDGIVVDLDTDPEDPEDKEFRASEPFLKSFCPGHSDNLTLHWRGVDCWEDGILGGVLLPDGHEKPFDYLPTQFSNHDFVGGFEFKGNGSINIDARKMTYQFWLVKDVFRSGSYQTGVQTYEDGELTKDGAFTTLHIHKFIEMCLNKKRGVGCVGGVNFGDVVFEQQ